MPSQRTAIRTLALASAAATLLAASGCYFPGGPGYSADSHTLESFPHQPQTFTLIDTRTGEAVFSNEIPVGMQLVVEFYTNRGVKDSALPDMMRSEVMEIGKITGGLEHKMDVPPKWGRRIDVTLRETPELPANMRGGRGGSELVELPEEANGE